MLIDYLDWYAFPINNTVFRYETHGPSTTYIFINIHTIIQSTLFVFTEFVLSLVYFKEHQKCPPVNTSQIDRRHLSFISWHVGPIQKFYFWNTNIKHGSLLFHISHYHSTDLSQSKSIQKCDVHTINTVCNMNTINNIDMFTMFQNPPCCKIKKNFGILVNMCTTKFSSQQSFFYNVPKFSLL